VPNAIAPANFEFYKNTTVYNTMVNLRIKLPAKVYIMLARLIGNPQMIKNISLLEFLCNKYD